MSARLRAVLWTVPLVAGALLLMTWIAYARKPPRGDEMDFVQQASEGVRLHGVPAVYPQDTRRQMTDNERRYDAFYGLWHPPLYIYVLAGAGSLSNSIAAYRLVGALCLLASMAILWAMARDALGADAPVPVRALPVTLALLAPVVTQGSLLLDIDNSVLLLQIVFFIRQTLRTEDFFRPARFAWLTLLMFVMGWTKLTTPFIVIGACAIYAAAARRSLRPAVALACVAALALALVAVTLRLYFYAFDLPWRFMFDVGFASRRDLFASVKTLEVTLRALRWIVAWTSPAVLVVIGAACLDRARALAVTRQVEPADLPMLAAVLIFAAYAVVGAMFGKYVVPAIVLGAFAAGVSAVRGWSRIQLPRIWPMAVTLAAAAALALWLPVARVRLDRPVYLGTALHDPRNLAMLAELGIALVAMLAWARGRAALLAVVVVAATITPIQELRIQFRGDDGPYHAGPDTGFAATAAYLRSLVPPGEKIVAPKDIGWASQTKFFAIESLNADLEPDLLRLRRREPIAAVADSLMYPAMTRETVDKLDPQRVEVIGSFVVYILGPRP